MFQCVSVLCCVVFWNFLMFGYGRSPFNTSTLEHVHISFFEPFLLHVETLNLKSETFKKQTFFITHKANLSNILLKRALIFWLYASIYLSLSPVLSAYKARDESIRPVTQETNDDRLARAIQEIHPIIRSRRGKDISNCLDI